jgi:hypothetical protein
MIRHGIATAATTAQSLATALGLAENQAVRYLSVQPLAANTAVLEFGGQGVTTSVFGFRLEIPVTNIPSAPMIITDAIAAPGLKVGDLYFIGANTNDKIAVMWIPYE